MLKLIIFFTVIIPIFCGKLSEEFDEERAEMCGIANKPEKPSSNSADDIVPWSVRLDYPPNYSGSAMIISPRHVLASSFMAINVTDEAKKRWIWRDGTLVDFAKCQDNEMKIPKKYLKQLKVAISVCKDVNRCGTHIERSVVDGYYIGNCESGEIPFGMLLLEISSNVPQNEPYFVPVCVPADQQPVNPKDVVHFDSLKYNRSARSSTISTGKATIEKCDAAIGLFAHSICGKLHTCPTELMAGSLVKKIDNRDTIVGIIGYHEDCKGVTSTHFSSIGFFKDKLCSLAGICKTTVPVEDSSATPFQLTSFIILSVIFLVK